VAVAVLVLWLCTAAVGSYLLATSSRPRKTSDAPPEPVSVAAEQAAAPAKPMRDKDRFDPQSLRDAKAEPLPGLKDLAEFAHPTLAMIGFGFWFGYVVSRDRLFLAIAIGIMLGAICAGISWFTANTRAARRAAAAEAADGDDRGDSAGAGGDSDVGPLTVSPRLLILHAVGAALTLLVAALIAARV
jgi:hypothetical protein